MRIAYNSLHFTRKVVLAFLIIILGLAQMPAYAQPLAQNTGADAYTYGDCAKVDKETLRAEIAQTARQVLTADSGGVAIPAIVARQWQTLNLDGVIDSEVARAVNKLGNEESYLNRLWSGWSADKAQEFTARIASDAFGSETFRSAIDRLSQAIAAEITREIEADFARAASAALLCMKAYVGQQYSAALFTAFEQKVSVEVGGVAITTTTPITVSVLDLHQKTLGGLGLIVVAEISKRLAQRLSTEITERIAGQIIERILGRVGSELIPIVGWVLGIALIAWDLWNGVQGALPQIQAALTSEEIKAKIRGEIADAIQKSLPQETEVVALQIAVNLMDDWDGFCNQHQAVCRLADANSTFRQILRDTPLDQLDKLSELVDSFVQYAGQVELDNALANGQFEALLALPTQSYAILRTAQGASTLLAWSALAGEQLDKVIALGLYHKKTPTDFDQNLLNALLAINDPGVVEKLLALNRAELTTLVGFAGTNLSQIAANTSLDDLRQLIVYLNQPAPTQTPVEQLAPKLASGEITVKTLLHPAPNQAGTGVNQSPTLTSTATMTIDATAPSSSAPSALYPNSVVIGSLLFVLLGLVLVLGNYWVRHRRRTN